MDDLPAISARLIIGNWPPSEQWETPVASSERTQSASLPQSDSMHGYAIAQRIHLLSSQVLAVEEGLLYPTLQKLLLKGWVDAEWGISETNRKVRFYRLTRQGRSRLREELTKYERFTEAIQYILRTA